MTLTDGGTAAVERARKFLADNPRTMLDDGVSVPHLLATDVLALHAMKAELIGHNKALRDGMEEAASVAHRRGYAEGYDQASEDAGFVSNLLERLAEPETEPTS